MVTGKQQPYCYVIKLVCRYISVQYLDWLDVRVSNSYDGSGEIA